MRQSRSIVRSSTPSAFAASATTDVVRPDVQAAFGRGDRRGFAVDVFTNRFVRHDVCVYVLNNNQVGPHTFLGCRTV